MRGATACVEWAGLLAPREEAPGGPACRATPPFSSGLESPIGGSLQARACLAFAIPLEGGRRVSVETCCRSPVLVRPARHPRIRVGRLCPAPPKRRPDLAPAIGRAGPVRTLRTNPPPGEFSSVRVFLWHRIGHKGLGHRPSGGRCAFSGQVRSSTTGLRQGTLRGASQCLCGSPKRTWLTGVSLTHRSGSTIHRSGPRGPPKRDPGGPPKRTGLARRSGPVRHLPGGPSWFGHSAVRRT